MLFPVLESGVQVTLDSPVSADPYRNGMRIRADNSALYVVEEAVDKSQSGLGLTSIGQVSILDVTLLMPSNVHFQNGFMFDEGDDLCVSTLPIVTWQNGLPFDAVGALVVEYV